MRVYTPCSYCDGLFLVNMRQLYAVKRLPKAMNGQRDLVFCSDECVAEFQLLLDETFCKTEDLK